MCLQASTNKITCKTLGEPLNADYVYKARYKITLKRIFDQSNGMLQLDKSIMFQRKVKTVLLQIEQSGQALLHFQASSLFWRSHHSQYHTLSLWDVWSHYIVLHYHHPFSTNLTFFHSSTRSIVSIVLKSAIQIFDQFPINEQDMLLQIKWEKIGQAEL